MNSIQKLTSGLVVFAALIPALAQTEAARTNEKKQKPTRAPTASVQMERGQQVFDRNCSRCHDAPEGIPPQISATVIRHMRVRASLSAADEKALLRLMNP